MDITLYPDEDWTVDSVIGSDTSAVTLTAPDGSEVRIEGDFKVLQAMAQRWLAELNVISGVDLGAPFADEKLGPAAFNYGQSKTLDKIDEKIDNLEALLTERNGGDDARYPADMQPGDWVRFPPARAWRKIDRVAEMDVGPWHVHYTYGGTAYFQPVRAETRYPYCPAARFDEVCDK